MLTRVRILLAVVSLGVLCRHAHAGRYYDASEMAAYSVPNSVSGDTFYVDGVAGSDTNNGLAPVLVSGSTGPFKTLAYCFNRYRSNNVRGGDVVKIKAGIYREGLRLQLTNEQVTTLSAATPLIVGPYGDGEVIIDPSSTPQTWTAHDANIYWANWAGPLPPWAVVLNDNFKVWRDTQSLAGLTRYGLWYYDTGTQKIYIHTGGINPSTLDPVITYNDRSAEQYAIFTNGYSYLRFYGLTLRGAARYGFSDYGGGTDIRVEKCKIKHNNSTGLRFFSSSSVLARNHIYGNMLYNWPRGRIWAANGGWGMGASVGSYSLAEGNIIHDNGGEGLGNGSGYTVLQDNIVYDNWSVGIYTDNSHHCTIQRNLVYSHDPDLGNIVDVWQLPSWILAQGDATINAETNKIKGRLRQEGIMIGDETATNPIAQSTDNKVLNNIIVGVRRGFTTYGQSTGAGMKNYVIANNTIVLPASAPVYGNFAGMELHQHSGNNTGTVIKNNIVFSSAATAAFQPLMLLDNAAMTGVALDDNLYYAAGSASPFTTGVYPSQVSYGFSAWKAAIFSGGDANSIYSDPGFSGSASGFAAADYMLSSGSPAVNGGASLADIIGDFNNFTRSGLPDIGALENGSFYGLDVFPPLRPKSLRLK